MFDNVGRWLILGAGFSFFAVFSQWEFFDEGVITLGFNSVIVLVFFWALVIKFRGLTHFSSRDWSWIIPLGLIGLSFGLFENPWLKTHCVWLLPLMTSFVMSYRVLPNGDGYFFGYDLLLFLIKRSFSPICRIGNATALIREEIIKLFGFKAGGASLRVALGVLILIPLASVVLLLLQSADQVFAETLAAYFKFITRLFSFELFWQLAAIVVLFTVFVSSNIDWNTKCKFESRGEHVRYIDDIVSGVVVGGIFLIYVLFVYVQIDQLFLAELPVDFSHAEVHVKSGFWQLITLSIINAVLFLWVYKKTGPSIQRLLSMFLIASGLIVLSAAWKISLYVYYYGLSYEKFFASYTVLFALVVFALLLIATFSSRRLNIAPRIIFLALWFFSVATVLPIEKIIFHSNIHLANADSSRIDLSELTALSLDVGADVVRNMEAGLLRDSLWFRWKMNKWNQQCTRPIYQMNLSSVMNCRAMKRSI